MASNCPHCGTPTPDEGRFCMGCGRERGAPGAPGALQEAPLPPPPLSPPSPAYAPGAVPGTVPAEPSPLGAFFGRVVRGDWGGAARAAAWPVGLLLAVATALAVPSYGQEPGEVAVGFADRLRIALALLLQSVGGDFEVAEAGDPLFGSGGGTGGGDGGAVSLVPLTVTVLWIVALLIGARVLRTRLATRTAGPAGLEAAVRVALLVTAAVFVLGLSAQPTVQGVEVSSSPLLAALGALALSLVVTAAALYRKDAAGRPAVPPAVRVLLRATGTAVRALAVVLVLCSLTAFVVLARVDGLDEALDLDDAEVPALLVALFLLPNLAVTALGLGWGAPVEAEGGSASAFGGGYEHESFGLAELGDAYGGWAVAGALALGTVCALTVGLMTARRCADRREQLLSAGVFFALFLLLAGLAGVEAEAAGGSSMYGTSGSGTFEAGPAIPETLLFGTLWLAAAVWTGPHLTRLLGLRTGTSDPAGLPGLAGLVSPAVPSAPSAASVPPAPSMPSAPPVPSVSPVPTESVGAAEASAAGASGGADPGGPGVDPEAPTASSVPPPPGVPPMAGHPARSAVPEPVHPPTVAPGYVYDPHVLQLGWQPASGTGTGTGERVAGAGAGDGGGASRNGALVWAVTLTVALLLGGGTAAGVLVWQDRDGDDSASGPPAGQSSSASAASSASPKGLRGAPSAPSASPTESTGSTGSTEPSPTPSGEPGPGLGPAEVPAGYHRLDDPFGFSFAVPDTWAREGVKNGTQVTYAGSTGLEHLQVGVIAAAGYTSYDNFLTLEKTAREKNDGYRRIRLERNTFQGRDGAVWEYTYTDAAGRLVHARDQGYVAANGTEYAILVVGHDDVWDSGLADIHQVALDTWDLT